MIDQNCSDPEDSRIHMAIEEIEEEVVFQPPGSNLKFQLNDEDETEQAHVNFAIAKRVTTTASLDKRVADDSELSSTEQKQALVRLAMTSATDDRMKEMKAIAEKECKADKDGRTIAYAVLVKNKDALADTNPDKIDWEKAISDEAGGLFKEGVLVEKPLSEVKSSDELLPALLLLNIKWDGRKKARIVACGNFQKLTSAESYSSVVSHDTWLQMLTIGLRLGHSAFQIDISQAFLQTEESDDDPTRPRTYLRPPKNCGAPEGVVWQVMKSIYGLRSAPLAWQKTLTRFLEEQNFVVSSYDDTVFMNEKTGVKCFVYVDDVFCLGPNKECIKFLTLLRKRFRCTDWCPLATATKQNPLMFLGHALWMEQDENGTNVLRISQQAYVEELLKRFGMEDCNGLSTLRPEMYDHAYLMDAEALKPSEISSLRGIIGALSFLAQGTRPDILVATSHIAEGQSSGTHRHMDSAKRILRYLKNTAGRSLYLPLTPFESKELELKIQFDANFCAGKARTGLVLSIAGTMGWWSSKKQRCIVLSTCESELIAAGQAAKEILGCCNFLSDVWGSPGNGGLKFNKIIEGDNNAANTIAARQSGVRKVRHLTLADLFARQAVAEHGVQIRYVPTLSNVADVGTKVLTECKLAPLCQLVGLFLNDADREKCLDTRLVDSSATAKYTSTKMNSLRAGSSVKKFRQSCAVGSS